MNHTCSGDLFERHGKKWGRCLWDGTLFAIRAEPLQQCPVCRRPWTGTRMAPDSYPQSPGVAIYIDLPHVTAERDRLKADLAAARAEAEAYHRAYVDVADAVLPESDGPEMVVREARRLRDLVTDRQRLIAESEQWQRAAESQNRQWSAKCTELTEMRARAEQAERERNHYFDRCTRAATAVALEEATVALAKWDGRELAFMNDAERLAFRKDRERREDARAASRAAKAARKGK